MKLNPFTTTILVMFVAVLLAFLPDLSGNTRSTTLGSIDADITGNGTKETIVKVKLQTAAETKIALIVYRDKKRLAQVFLPGDKDTVFSFKQERGNLFSADIDGDGILDVVTISRNNKVESKLSVLSYKNGQFTSKL